MKFFLNTCMASPLAISCLHDSVIYNKSTDTAHRRVWVAEGEDKEASRQALPF